MTATTSPPASVSWAAPAGGTFSRTLRYGEWISAPVTPLFESWLLTDMEERLHQRLLEGLGQRAPRPFHVVVNGWYFYSLNWMTPGSFARNMPRLLWKALRDPRRVAGIVPPTVRHSIPVFERDWRTELQPRYRATVAAAEARVETLPVGDLPDLIDELAEVAGDYFMSIAALGGAAYKMEINLARFYRRHLGPTLGGSHLPLLAGFEAPLGPEGHAVSSLDWWYEPSPATGGSRPGVEHARVVEARRAAEDDARQVLARSPRTLRAFDRLLADAQHVVPIREEQARELTLAWPAMRRAVIRIGEALVEHSAIEHPDHVFFLTRAEALEALASGRVPSSVDVAGRSAQRERDAALPPPLFVGTVHPMLRRFFEALGGMVGAVRSETALVSGTPASPGRATGVVRVVRGPESFDELQPGEILVAPITAPAWTPLFTIAAAVVTDVGSVAAHASVIAREYGIPAVVGCGDATVRLRTGMLVTVDGTRGNVEPG